MDIYAIPKMFLLGASDSVFKNPDGSMKAAWQMVLGSRHRYPGRRGRHESPRRREAVRRAVPEPHLADLNALAKLMARETDLPDSDFALTDIANPTSADSYNAVPREPDRGG
jgi:hypothetical protein